MKEECRDARGTRWLEELWQDLRCVLRTSRQKPGFAAVALVTLALGSGATTVMFTVINGVLLKPFPYPEPDRLVQLQEQTDWSTQWGNLWVFPYPNYVDCKRESRALEVVAWRNNGGTLSEPGEAEYVNRSEVSYDLFSILGVPLFRGRVFLPEEDAPVHCRWRSLATACGRVDVIWLVLRQSLAMIFLGVVVGTAGALAAGRLMVRLVEGTQPMELSTFATTIALLVAAALVASFVPARRASRVDPLIALRQE